MGLDLQQNKHSDQNINCMHVPTIHTGSAYLGLVGFFPPVSPALYVDPFWTETLGF